MEIKPLTPARRSGRPRLDLAGQRFGQLTALAAVGKANNQIVWDCRCDCGNRTVVRGNHLRRGETISCGCGLKTRPNGVAAKETARREAVEEALRRLLLVVERVEVAGLDEDLYRGALSEARAVLREGPPQ